MVDKKMEESKSVYDESLYNKLFTHIILEIELQNTDAFRAIAKNDWTGFLAFMGVYKYTIASMLGAKIKYYLATQDILLDGESFDYDGMCEIIIKEFNDVFHNIYKLTSSDSMYTEYKRLRSEAEKQLNENDTKYL